MAFKAQKNSKLCKVLESLENQYTGFYQPTH